MISNYIEYKKPAVLRYIDSIKRGTREFWPSLQVALTDRCFNKCVMCGHWKRQGTRDDGEYTEQLLKMLNIGLDHGLESVGYSGGDPMAVPDVLNKVMKWHADEGVAFGIVTAGYRPKSVDLGLLRGAEWVRASLDSIHPGTYEKVRGVQVYPFSNSIEEMVSVGVDVGIGLTLSNLNLYSLTNTAEFAASVGVKEFRVWPIREHTGSAKFALRGKEIEFAIENLGKSKVVLDLYDIDNNLENIIEELHTDYKESLVWPCYASLYQAFVDASGDIFPCCTLAGDTEEGPPVMPIGHISQPALSYQLMRSNFLNRKDPWDYCQHCILRHRIANKIAETHWNQVCFQ